MANGIRRGLSDAEERVARLVADGLTNREIAEALGLSVKTVAWTLTKIYRKAGVRSRTELAIRLSAERAAGRFSWDQEQDK